MQRERYEQLLIECSKEYKLILEEYIEKNKINSIVDIIKLDNKVKRNLMNDTLYNYKTSFVIIELYSILLIIALLFMIPDFSKNVYAILSLLLMVSFIQLFNIFYTKTIRIYKTTKNVDIINYEIIKNWRRIEGLTNDLKIKNQKGYIINARTIEYLLNEKLINFEESIYLKELLKLRNLIVHKNDIQNDIQEIEDIIKKSKIIINRLEKIIGI